MTYHIVFSFNGLDYYGWQQQPQGPSIQSELSKAIRSVIGPGKRFRLLAAGRTDRGVSARLQHGQLILSSKVNCPSFRARVNSHLSDNIHIKHMVLASSGFNVIQHVASKSYRYYFCLGDDSPSRHIVNVKEWMDISRLEKAAIIFEGTHDFTHYQHKTGTPPFPVRKISYCRVKKAGNFSGKDVYYMEIRGKGFMRHMVRLIMGAIWEVGRGFLRNEDLIFTFLSDYPRWGELAPAHGLVLWKQYYIEGHDLPQCHL